MNDLLHEAVDIIVLVSAVCIALTNIYRTLKKPVDKVKEFADEAQKKHDEELTKSISKSIIGEIEPLIENVRQINLAQNSTIQSLQKSVLDLLRQEILYLYQHHQETKTLTHEEMEQLHKLYDDYSSQGGNSFVQSLYEQMTKWEIKD